MRAHDLLLEYDRSREQQRIEAIPAYQQRIQQDKDFNLEQLEQADPTPAKSYVPRLATWWLQGTKLEDLISRGADALERYQQLKQKNQLKPEHRDIGRFKKFADFEAAVREYQVAEPEPTENRGKYREVFRDDELIVVQVQDVTAAKFWGRTTQWCTAAKKNNMFAQYKKDGPIFVITPRKPIRPGERYQYWFNKYDAYDYQFMNELDETVDQNTLRFYPKLQTIFSKMNDDLVWRANPSDDEIIRAIEEHGTFVLIDIKNPSEAVQIAAIRSSHDALNYIQNPTPAALEYRKMFWGK